MKKAVLSVILIVAVASFIYAADVDSLTAATALIVGEHGGLGGGVCIDPNGYIITAAHVISHTGRTFVVFPDSPKLLEAEIVFKMSEYDLALIKVEREGGFPVISWGDSDAMKQGDEVWVCGHSGGLAWMVTRGIISARKYSSDGQEYLLTDSWGWYGNSGGGLFNQDGELVGIVQMTAVGYLLATTVNWFQPMIPALINSYEALKANKRMLEEANEKWREENKALIEEWERQREEQKKQAEEERKKYEEQQQAEEKKEKPERKRRPTPPRFD